MGLWAPALVTQTFCGKGQREEILVCNPGKDCCLGAREHSGRRDNPETGQRRKQVDRLGIKSWFQHLLRWGGTFFLPRAMWTFTASFTGHTNYQLKN